MYYMPSKTTLVLLSSLCIMVFVSIPRLAISQHVNWLDLSFRALYIFCTSVLFFYVNLKRRRLLISIVLFLVIDFLLIRFHLLFFTPVASFRVFRFLFNINMAIAVTMTILLSEIFRLLFRNAETRYEVLKNQVNPHFLFNSLNTINGLIMTDREAAVNYVNNMSDVFRYVIDMLKGRFGDKLQVTIDVQPGQLYCQLPPLALQILIENAVKHNVVSNSKPLHITIESQGNGLW
jgi:two-component system, LytTR family, sensor kinase